MDRSKLQEFGFEFKTQLDMNLLTPVTKIMKTDLVTVSAETTLTKAYQLFKEHNIHHLPVTEYKKIVGILSQSDFLKLLEAAQHLQMEANVVDTINLEGHTVAELMTTGMAKLETTDTIRTAIDIFNLNRFHALPVVENEELVGIVTTFDVIELLQGEIIKIEDYK